MQDDATGFFLPDSPGHAAFDDAEALQAALDSPVRHDSREVTKGLLAMFDGRVRHHVFDLAHGGTDA